MRSYKMYRDNLETIHTQRTYVNIPSRTKKTVKKKDCATQTQTNTNESGKQNESKRKKANETYGKPRKTMENHEKLKIFLT